MSEIIRSADGQRLMVFEGLNDQTSMWSFREDGTRCPNKGEFFVSGSIPAAYKARQHLTMEYTIVKPIKEYTRRTVWIAK